MKQAQNYHTLIAGGGIAGLVTALELLQQGQSVCIIDRDTPERLGGLARWAFGGMALSNTKQQQKLNIPDSSERLLADWHSFAQFTNESTNENTNENTNEGSNSESTNNDPENIWPKRWAKEYAEHNTEQVYHYLLQLGLRFLPAVNWVERGLNGEGNSVPRYHVLWGTGWQLVETIIAKLKPYITDNKLTIYYQHKVQNTLTDISKAGTKVIGAAIENEQSAERFNIYAQHIVIACGGINGSSERVQKNWFKAWGKPPTAILNGANPISDGLLHDHVAKLGGNITHCDKMWNYAAGITHPQAEFDGHGLSLIPCKSALWLDHTGKRIGGFADKNTTKPYSLPLVTGFDTRYLCEQVSKQEKPWTWQVLNWNIAAKELAVSGSLHNPSIRNHSLLGLLKELVFGNQRLVKQLEQESDDFIVADSLEQLVEEMNQQTDQAYIDKAQLTKQIQQYDERLSHKQALQNDDQVRRIHHARQWQADKLRTCKPAPILKQGVKLIAIKLQLISRKSLGGIQTNLQSQVLNKQQQTIENLYCVGEAAGFGGGGANGLRSLEGTFLSSCILTARNAAKAILANNQNDEPK